MIAAVVSFLAALAADEPAIVDAVDHFVAAFRGAPAPTAPVAPEVRALIDPVLAQLRARAAR